MFKDRFQSRGCRELATLCLASLMLLVGCATPLTRPVMTEQQLVAARNEVDRKTEVMLDSFVEQNLVRGKAKYDDFVAGRAKSPPVMDILIISGGGEFGSFGSGFLKGWGKASGDMARPQFDVVTGVSTGALIAPFAFVGDDESYEKIDHLYRNPKKDWVHENRLLGVIFGKGESFLEIDGLERDIRAAIDMDMVSRIAKESADGRLLAVNTTNLDTGQMQPWDVTAQAKLAVQAKNTDPVIQVLLASSAIPGAFPPRELDGGLYVDGFVTGNILFSGRTTRSDSDTFIGRWKEKYPNIPPPKLRYWLIYNNQLEPELQTTQPQWTAILTRTVDASSHASSVTAIQKLFLQTQIGHLMYGADVEVRFVAIPDSWVQTDTTLFSPKTMNDLADIGERMGADPASWKTSSP